MVEGSNIKIKENNEIKDLSGSSSVYVPKYYRILNKDLIEDKDFISILKYNSCIYKVYYQGTFAIASYFDVGDNEFIDDIIAVGFLPQGDSSLFITNFFDIFNYTGYEYIANSVLQEITEEEFYKID